VIDAPGAGSVSQGAVGLIKWQGVPTPRSIAEGEGDDSSFAGGEAGEAATPSVIPSPTLDGELDWIFRFVAPFPVGFGAGALASTVGSSERFQESSAMRRLGNDSGLLWVYENWTVSNMNYAWDVRCLIKE